MIAKPGTFNKVPSQVSMRIPRARAAVIEDRNTKARWEVYAETKGRFDVLAGPGPLAAGKDFAAGILSALGLDGRTDCPPAPVLLVEPGDATAIHRGRGGKPPRTTATPGPKPDPLDGIEHNGMKYPTCRCRGCKDVYNTWHRTYMRRKRADAKAAREAGLA